MRPALVVALAVLHGCAGRVRVVEATPVLAADARPVAPATSEPASDAVVSVRVTGVARTHRHLYVEVDVVNASESQPLEILGWDERTPHLLVEELRNGTWTQVRFLDDDSGLDARTLPPGRRLPDTIRHERLDRVPVRVGVRYREPGADEWRAAWSDPIGPS
jgi:hypothetical protein